LGWGKRRILQPELRGKSKIKGRPEVKKEFRKEDDFNRKNKIALPFHIGRGGKCKQLSNLRMRAAKGGDLKLDWEGPS